MKYSDCDLGFKASVGPVFAGGHIYYVIVCNRCKNEITFSCETSKGAGAQARRRGHSRVMCNYGKE